MKFPRIPRQPLPGLFLFAAAGIAAAEYLDAYAGVLPAVVVLLFGSGILALLRRSTAWVLLFSACTFFLLHAIARRDDPGRELAAKCPAGSLAEATGIIVTEPQEKTTPRGGATSEFRLRVESLKINGENIPTGDAVVLAKWIGDGPQYGDRIRITGEIAPIAPPRNPGEFDYAAYMKRLGIYSRITMLDAASGEVVESGCGNPIVALAMKARHAIQRKITLGLENSPDTAGLIQGLTLGLKNETPEEIKELFQRTGTLHLFVVNGLHIGMFAAIAFLFSRLLGAGRALSIMIVIPLLCFYALLTGASTGSIRAAIMAVILLSGRLLDGKPAMLNNLAAAGLVIFGWNTNELFMPGFQFSFGVVFAIILLAGPLQRFLGKLGEPDPFLPRSLWNPFQKATQYCWRHVTGLLGVSAAASIGSLPFAGFYFNLLTPSSVVANMVVVPIAFLILGEAMLSAFTGLISNWFAVLFNNVNWLLAHAILAAVHLFAQIPGGHAYVEIPDFKKAPACEITVLDLDSGGAIHLRSGGRDWLVDCGNGMAYATIVQPYLHSRGINRLDGFVVSHGSTKFNAAAVSVEEDFTPAASADSPLDDRSPARRAFHEWLTQHTVPRKTVKAGDTLDISPKAKIRVLYPPPDSNARAADDKTLVLQLECDGRTVLFMSAASPLVENWLLESIPGLHCDILVKSPRGTENLDFVEAIRPKVVICSSSNVFASGHIDDTWAMDVVSRGALLFRQDKDGAVNVKIDGGKFTVRSFIGDQAWPDTAIPEK